MKNILKLLSLFLLLPFVFQSCTDSADRDWKSASPSFTLYNTTLSSSVLYPSMENNTFRLTWDRTIGNVSSYDVVFSTTSNFASKITLASVSKLSYTTTIGALNTALLQAGYSPYALKKVYFRVETGNDVSNSISFDVTPYPVSVPVITSPTAGSALVLDKTMPDDIASSVKWTDYNTYGVDVKYTVEIAKSGTTNFVSIGQVTNLRKLDVTNKDLNTAVLKAGLTADVQGNVDVKVTATTKSTGGTINKVSQLLTFKVTPYIAFVNLFLVGNATAAGWDPNNNNQAIFRDPSNTKKFYFTGKFGTDQFKLLEVLGQWQPQWGVNGTTVAVNDGSSSDPSSFTVSTSGYYTFVVDIAAKTYSFTSFTGSTSTNYTSIGLIGSATPNGWSGDTAMTQSSFDPHQWVKKGVVLTAGEAKFRANGGWTINWGANTEYSGQGVQDGANIPVSEAGTYNVYFNDLDGRYLLIKQ